MTDKKETERKKLSLSGKGTLSLKTPPASTQGSSSRSGTVAVEVKRKRSISPTSNATLATGSGRTEEDLSKLTSAERDARIKALEQAKTAPKAAPKPSQTKVTKVATEEVIEEAKKSKDEELREQELAKLKEIQESEKSKANEAEVKRQEEIEKQKEIADQQALLSQAALPEDEQKSTGRKVAGYRAPGSNADNEAVSKRRIPSPARRGAPKRRNQGSMTVTQALNMDEERGGKTKSLAAQRRAREKERMQANGPIETIKQVHDVIIPEAITVQELANRMKERSGDVVKKLMEIGVMATVNQTIDTDTAELIVQEFGHTPNRVSESDVEDVMTAIEDDEKDLKPRPPVVTVMGHVDHGKTSLLDAIRSEDIASGEAGGITQHIGAYQIKLKSGQKISFLDTPGHAAFTEMRARGADVTDIVVLVVAANDSVMPQTIEAINHAQAAEKPIIVAINKCDLPEADPDKVRTELLQHNVIVESMSGDVLCVEVSAKTKKGLQELEEAIALQTEMMNLCANPKAEASGAVVESKMEQGRGSVATVLIQRGTLHIGDIFVAGAEWGKVRALIDDRGNKVKTAIPSQPIEILGLNGTPEAGDDFAVVKDEAKAREITEFRTRRKRALQTSMVNKGSLEQLMSKMQEGVVKNLAVLVKGDVHGSVEAINSSLTKLTEDNDEVNVKILHSAVGGITESDVTLANASNAMIIAFNVRANAQARALAKKENVEIRYYSIIYEAIDDVKALLGGMLSPTLQENFIGYAEIRQVFNITKVGKVAGCMITDGIVKRGSRVRLLRDDVVIHEGTLKTLQRFKDEVKDVREGYECGMAFENYDDIKEGDMIEAFEIEEKARELEVKA